MIRAAFVILNFFFYGLPSIEAKPVRKNTAEPVKLRLLARGFQKPLQLVFAAKDPRAMYVVEQGGRIYRLHRKQRRLFADLSALLNSSSGEEGLLGLAFPPTYRLKASSCYVNYTAGRPSYTHIAELRVKSGRAQTRKMRTLLRFRQPYRNHNGGMLLFGPDQKLYIGTGDGGAAGDPLNAGQDRQSLLGKILRIDVRSARGRPYGIPTDNPFASQSRSRPEIYAWGLRNPWRFSFDSQTGRLYAADVGQNRYEEIDLIVPGGNYGWRRKEGYKCYNPSKKCEYPGLIDPIHAYSHREGQSVTGGYVYRGKKLKNYQGHYFFADFVSGKLWALPLQKSNGRAAGKARLLLKKAGNISSFGEDLAGELYLIEYSRGAVYKIIP